MTAVGTILHLVILFLVIGAGVFTFKIRTLRDRRHYQIAAGLSIALFIACLLDWLWFGHADVAVVSAITLVAFFLLYYVDKIRAALD